MIVREEGDRLVLVRQTDHALLSGWLAAAWGAAPWSPPVPYDACVVAGRIHDLPWAAFDETLPRRSDGRPYAFDELARSIVTPMYGRGLDAIERIDPYAALLSSLHFSGFFVSHWGWMPRGPLPAPSDEEGRAIASFVERELARQGRLRERLGIDEAGDRELRFGYLLLQLWDRLSLDICRRGFHGWSDEYPPTPVGPEPDARVVRLRVALEPGGVCLLDPYPLVVSPYRARVPAVEVPRPVADDGAGLRLAWREGGADAIEVTFQPA